MELIEHIRDWEAFKDQVETDNKGRNTEICTRAGLEKQYRAGKGSERLVYFLKKTDHDVDRRGETTRIAFEVHKQKVKYPLDDTRF